MRAISLLAMLSAVVWSQAADPNLTFEAASIKQSPPPDGGPIGIGCRGGPGSSDPVRITCTHYNMGNMVMRAYDLPHYRVSGITFGDNNYFEFAIKVPEGATKDQVKIMWQNLLAERFKLTIHRENKDMQVFELVVAKGGLKAKPAAPPAPANSGPSTPRPAPSGPERISMGSDGFPVLRGPGMIIMNGKARWGAPEGTMAELCNMLASQLSQPVNDGTGLTGKYDLGLYWVTDNGIMPGTRAAGAPSEALPETDISGPTLQTAIQSQLGLALEKKKGQIEVLVVDHYEKNPTEN